MIAPLLGIVLILAIAAGALALFILVSAYNEAAKWTHPARLALTSTPAQYGLRYEERRLTTEDGLHIAAWYIPSTNGATIIMLHGLGGNRGSDLPLVRDLAARGYGFIIPDLRAHGESDGRASTLGLNEVRDVRACMTYLQSRSDVDMRRIGVLGTSLGASVAIMSAAEIPELRAVVATSSFSSIEWVVEHQFEKVSSMPSWLAQLVVGMGSLQAGVDAKQIAPVERIARISPRPVLIIHGQEDDIFSAENAVRLYDAARDPKELWIIPGVPHPSPTVGPYASNPRAYVERVAAFFDSALLSK